MFSRSCRLSERGRGRPSGKGGDVEAKAAWGGNHRGEGGNILFLDGHVEWFNAHHRGGLASLKNDLWRVMTTSNGLHVSAWEDDTAW